MRYWAWHEGQVTIMEACLRPCSADLLVPGETGFVKTKSRAPVRRPRYPANSSVSLRQALDAAGHGTITTEIREAPELYYAEEYHQQYLAKNPDGYCGLGGTGVSCPTGV